MQSQSIEMGNRVVPVISYRRARVLYAIDRAVSVAIVIVALAIIIAAVVSSTPGGIFLGAAVTVNARVTNVAGGRKFREVDMSGGNGDTFDTRMRRVRWVAFTPKTNAPTATAQSTVSGYITLTFTTGGAFTNVLMVVCGY